MRDGSHALGALPQLLEIAVFRSRSGLLSAVRHLGRDSRFGNAAHGIHHVSGMLHTEFTIAPIQFAAYGMLIIAMILRAVELSGDSQNRFSLWYSLGYLTAFSMAIPVVYHSEIENAVLFHVIESAVMLLLVLSFTLMLRRLFLGKGENLLLWVPFIIMAVGDAVVLWMRWAEEINSFVLIFACLSAVLFIIGKVISGIKR